MTPIDPTVVVERMARRLRSDGADHPVAGAVALAARGATKLPLHAFARSVDLLPDVVVNAERGAVALGDLPSEIGALAFATGADLFVPRRPRIGLANGPTPSSSRHMTRPPRRCPSYGMAGGASGAVGDPHRRLGSRPLPRRYYLW